MAVMLVGSMVDERVVRTVEKKVDLLVVEWVYSKVLKMVAKKGDDLVDRTVLKMDLMLVGSMALQLVRLMVPR